MAKSKKERPAPWTADGGGRESDSDPFEHGTDGGYTNWHCRGERCSKAHSDSYKRRRRQRQVAR